MRCLLILKLYTAIPIDTFKERVLMKQKTLKQYRSDCSMVWSINDGRFRDLCWDSRNKSTMSLTGFFTEHCGVKCY